MVAAVSGGDKPRPYDPTLSSDLSILNSTAFGTDPAPTIWGAVVGEVCSVINRTPLGQGLSPPEKSRQLTMKKPDLSKGRAFFVQRRGGVYPRPQESRFYVGLKIIIHAWAIKILIIMYGKAGFMNPIKDIL